MKAKQLLKRSYYALISGALLLALIAILNIVTIPYSDGEYYRVHPIRFPILIGVFALIYCWVMTRHNKRDGYILIGVIILTAVLGLAQYLSDYFIWYVSSGIADCMYLPPVSIAVMFICGACMMVAGFSSETKYHNLLPNQSNTASKVFRVLSWIGQFIVWALGIMCLIASLF